MRFQIGGGNDKSDIEKLLFGQGDGARDAVSRHTVSWTDDDGKTHTETQTTIKPSKSGALAGVAAGTVVAGPIGGIIGGIAGFIFGPAD